MQPLLTQRFQLGECPRWDEQTQTLWWVDINEKQLHCFNTISATHQQRQFTEEIGCFALRQTGGLVIGGRSGLSLIASLYGEVHAIGDPEAHLPKHRFNDGRCDTEGRFIAGTMNPDKNQTFGRFYQLNKNHQIKALVGRSWTCNGLAFSPDGKTLYWSDTPQRTIYRCDYDLQTGAVSNQRIFYQVAKNRGRPDGATVDSLGNYWSALYAGGEILCISPYGKLLHSLKVPVTNPTMLTFGGSNLQTMYITSACQKMTKEQLTANPMEGQLLSCPAPYPGLIEPRFAG